MCVCPVHCLHPLTSWWLTQVTQVVADPLTRALDIANAIAARSPDSTAAAKRLLNATYSEANDDARALKLETALQRKLLLGWNMLACTAKGLGVPPAIQPGFCNRSSEWDVEVRTDNHQSLAQICVLTWCRTMCLHLRASVSYCCGDTGGRGCRGGAARDARRLGRKLSH